VRVGQGSLGDPVVFDGPSEEASGRYKPMGKYPVEVSVRLSDALALASKKSQSIPASDWANTQRLSAQAKASTSSERRYFWLLASANAFGSVVEPLSACKKGCSHCCYGPVPLHEAEARAVARSLGVSTRAIHEVERLERDSSIDASQPCVFNKLGVCAIYESRPLSCRTKFNLDRDDLLCRHAPESHNPVPFASTSLLKTAQSSFFKDSGLVADIRHWFEPSVLQSNP